MSIIGGKEVFLFSKVSAHLTYEGKTASNIPVHRIVQYEGEKFEDTIKTNENGFFSFPPLSKKEFSILPKEFVSHQKLVAEYKGKLYLVWETVKRSEEENSELEGRKLDLKCEITGETKFFHLMLHSIGTNCTWSN